MAKLVLYHGTRGKSLKGLLKSGLRSFTYSKANPNYMLTTTKSTAKSYGGREGRFRKPVIVEFSFTSEEKPRYLHRGVSSGWGDVFYAPKRPIPARFISNVYEVVNGRVRVKEHVRRKVYRRTG